MAEINMEPQLYMCSSGQKGHLPDRADVFFRSAPGRADFSANNAALRFLASLAILTSTFPFAGILPFDLYFMVTRSEWSADRRCWIYLNTWGSFENRITPEESIFMGSNLGTVQK